MDNNGGTNASLAMYFFVGYGVSHPTEDELTILRTVSFQVYLIQASSPIKVARGRRSLKGGDTPTG